MINQLYKQPYGVLYQQLTIDLSIISIWFSNQWFVFNKHSWIWFLSSFVVSVLTCKRALEMITVLFCSQWIDPKHTLDDDSCLVLESVICLPITHLTMILVRFVISFFYFQNTHLTLIRVLLYNQWFHLQAPNAQLTMIPV